MAERDGVCMPERMESHMPERKEAEACARRESNPWGGHPLSKRLPPGRLREPTAAATALRARLSVCTHSTSAFGHVCMPTVDSEVQAVRAMVVVLSTTRRTCVRGDDGRRMTRAP